ncbi:uncharacterized protein LOC129594611 [Paramacrobiotus metropolitanus]|uniref:uncharacterized protein LOC129594611 n=1 Tax=Paramacrobiotus metropolitanus TaxID=2943436 RepID=UPI002446539C|nr:uncharacterized protein LOC129594611 [Paramacrobiotus metropolitanus]
MAMRGVWIFIACVLVCLKMIPATEGGILPETVKFASSNEPSFLCPSDISQTLACCRWNVYSNLTDFIDSTTWERPRGDSNFVTATDPLEVQDASKKTLFSTCNAGEDNGSSRTAMYQSKGGLWADGQPVRLQFWYKIHGQDEPHAKLTLSTVAAPGRELHTVWSASGPRDEWTTQEVIVQEDEVYQLRFSAFHACATSIGLAGITARKVELVEDTSCLPTTTVTTTTTTTTSTTTTVPSTMTLTMRLIRFSRSEDCDPAWWFLDDECDMKFSIQYSWVDENGRARSLGQSYRAPDDTNSVTFPSHISVTANVKRNSRAAITIEAVDIDPWLNPDDHIANFNFQYNVPQRPEGTVRRTDNQNYAEMVVEFSTKY